MRTHSNKTTQEGRWGGEERARKHRYSLSSTSDKPNGIILADEIHPLTETRGHTDTHKLMHTHTHTHTHVHCTHTVMLKNNPHSHSDNNEHINNMKQLEGNHAWHIFMVTTLCKIHWPITVASTENIVSCPVQHSP